MDKGATQGCATILGVIGLMCLCSYGYEHSPGQIRAERQAVREDRQEQARALQVKQSLYTTYGEPRMKQMYLEAGMDMQATGQSCGGFWGCGDSVGCDPNDESCSMDDKVFMRFKKRTGLSSEQYDDLILIGNEAKWPNKGTSADSPK